MSLMQSDWNKKRNYDKNMQLPKSTSTQHAAPITKLIITYMNTVITITWNKGGNGNGRWENGE